MSRVLSCLFIAPRGLLDQAEERVLTELRGAREEQREALGQGLAPGSGLTKKTGPGLGQGKAQGQGKGKGQEGSGAVAGETTKRKWHEDADKGSDKGQGHSQEKGEKKRKGSQ